MNVTAERILVVDDEEPIRQLVVRILAAEGRDCMVAADAAEARRLLTESDFALVLCDLNMPGESGLDLVKQIRSTWPDVAVVMVTGADDPGLASIAIGLGAYGYVIKPFRRSELVIGVANALRRRGLEIENRRYREDLEATVAERTAELEEAVDLLRRSERELRRSREETVKRLALAVELRDGETGEHVDRMGRICGALAGKLGLDAERCELIRIASPLHDIGKIAVPDSILLKPAPLTEAEWVIMRSHAEVGHRMLRDSGQEMLDLAATMAYTHHERMNGTGYPRGLAGEDIPVEGRIAAVADVFDALVTDRVYQQARPVAEALEILRDGRGSLFDADVLDLFLDGQQELLATARTGPG